MDDPCQIRSYMAKPCSRSICISIRVGVSFVEWRGLCVLFLGGGGNSSRGRVLTYNTRLNRNLSYNHTVPPIVH